MARDFQVALRCHSCVLNAGEAFTQYPGHFAQRGEISFYLTQPRDLGFLLLHEYHATNSVQRDIKRRSDPITCLLDDHCRQV